MPDTKRKAACTADQLAAVVNYRREGKGACEIGKLMRPELSTEASESWARRVIQKVEGITGRASLSGDTPLFPESVAGSSDGTIRREMVTSRLIGSRDEAIEAFGIDEETTELIDWTSKTWQMGSMPRTVGNDKEGWARPSTTPIVTQLYANSFRCRPKIAESNAREALRATIDELKNAAPVRLYLPKNLPRPGRLLVLSVPDVHVGKLAWGLECGGSNYDLKIAAEVFREAVSYLLDGVRGQPIERIVFPLGNDLLNCDNPSGMTTGGTPQSNDGRYHKAFRTAKELMVEAIEALREIAPVDVLTVPGNHDTLSAWTLAEAIAGIYHKDAAVSFDNDPTLRKYYRWGRTLLGFTHGDKEKPADLPLLMYRENNDYLTGMRYFEWFLGHHHKSAQRLKQVSDEIQGVKMRTVSSLCATDAWHFGQGYAANIRSAEAYLFDQKTGPCGSVIFNVSEE